MYFQGTMLGHHIWVTAHHWVAHMFTSTNAYDFSSCKTKFISNPESPQLCAGVRCYVHCAKTSAEKKQPCNIGLPPLKLFIHVKRSTLYAVGNMVMWWTKFSQLNGLPKIIIILDGDRDIFLENHKSTGSLKFASESSSRTGLHLSETWCLTKDNMH